MFTHLWCRDNNAERSYIMHDNMPWRCPIPPISSELFSGVPPAAYPGVASPFQPHQFVTMENIKVEGGGWGGCSGVDSITFS